MKLIKDKQLKIGDRFGLFRTTDKKWICIAKKVKSPISYQMEKGHKLSNDVISDIGYGLYERKYVKYLIENKKDYLFITKHIILNNL